MNKIVKKVLVFKATNDNWFELIGDNGRLIDSRSWAIYEPCYKLAEALASQLGVECKECE